MSYSNLDGGKLQADIAGAPRKMIDDWPNSGRIYEFTERFPKEDAIIMVAAEANQPDYDFNFERTCYDVDVHSDTAKILTLS